MCIYSHISIYKDTNIVIHIQSIIFGKNKIRFFEALSNKLSVICQPISSSPSVLNFLSHPKLEPPPHFSISHIISLLSCFFPLKPAQTHPSLLSLYTPVSVDILHQRFGDRKCHEQEHVVNLGYITQNSFFQVHLLYLQISFYFPLNLNSNTLWV